MCEPATILAITAGTATFAGGAMQARAKHNAAKAAAERQNYINDLTYKNQMNQAVHADQIKANRFQRQLEAHAAAQTALYRQMEVNQLERGRVSLVAQQQLEEKITETAFEGVANVAAQIQAQGQVLASNAAAGHSLLLQLMDSERALGMQEAQLNATLRDANKAYNMQEYGFDLDQYSADMLAANRMPGAPQAESASFAPIRKPKVAGPSGLGLLGGTIAAAGAGLSAGVKTYGATPETWR
tara:strand:+ start:227 stop:952 length:726 start_codon:yes stop_codon:yes gene_type:complete